MRWTCCKLFVHPTSFTCVEHQLNKNQHNIDKKRQKPWNFMSTWYRHRFLCRDDVDIKIHDFCRFLSMLSICDVDFCRMYVRHMSTTWDRPKLTSDQHTIGKKRQKTWILMLTSCRQKSRQKSTKINQNRQKVDKNRPKFVDIMSTNDIRPTPERHKGRVQHVSFLSCFMSTSCWQNDNFLSIFGRFWLILVDTKSTKINQNRPKTRVEHVFDTCRRRFIDTMSTKPGRHNHHVPRNWKI